MWSTLRRFMLPVVALAMTTGCSSDDSGGDKAQGESAAEVCGGFAKSVASSAALEALAGEGKLSSKLSEPDKVLVGLRQAARTEQSAKTRQQGTPFCWLSPAEGGQAVLRIEFREALALPGRDADDEKVATFFASGALSSSSDSHASVYFKCTMKAPAHEIIISAELEGLRETEAASKDIRTNQITLANAAARDVATDLGCQNDTKLVSGVPKPAA